MKFIHPKKKMSQCAKYWLESQKFSVKESSYAHYKNIIVNHIIPFFGNCKINNIDNKNIQEFNNYLIKNGNKRNSRGLGTKTIKDINTILLEILRFFDININYKSPKVIKKDIKILTKYEQSRLEKYILDNFTSYNLGILISLYTGLRIGEICALKW